jgi:hypothetical protein
MADTTTTDTGQNITVAPTRSAPSSHSPRLRRLLLIAGTMLALQGAANVILGPWLHFAESHTPGSESDARFLGGVLVGLGVTWIHLSRQPTLPLTVVRLLAAGMLLGAAGRLLALTTGPMSVLTILVTAIEVVISTVVLILSRTRP